MDINQSTNQRILKALEVGVLPWHKRWRQGLPKHLTTGQEFRGINILVLGTTSFRSRYWVTYREAQRLGGYVRRGERATPVVCWQRRTDPEIELHRSKTRQEVMAGFSTGTRAMFNLDQTEGLKAPIDDFIPLHPDRLECAELLWRRTPEKPKIVHQQRDRSWYQATKDRIFLPSLSQIQSAEAYYWLLYRELVHATGHPKRLNRIGTSKNGRQYGFEKLVVELGTSFLCAVTGIRPPVSEEWQRNQCAGWAQAFQQDPRLLIGAASTAQQAVDYIRGQRVRTSVDGIKIRPLGIAVRQPMPSPKHCTKISPAPKERRLSLVQWMRRIASTVPRLPTNRRGR